MAPHLIRKRNTDKWLVDLRKWGGGRLYFDTQQEAERRWAKALKEQSQWGRMAFDLPLEDRQRYLSTESELADLGTTLREVVDFWKANHRPLDLKPVADAVEACLEAKKSANRRFRYIQQLGYSLRSFAQSVKGKNCSDVTGEDVEAWIKNDKWSPIHKKGMLTDLRLFFRFCQKRKWLVVDPLESVERITVDTKRPGILTLDQTHRLFTACRSNDPQFMPWLVLGVFCGVRPEEIRKLNWRHVDLERGLVDVPPELSKIRRRGRYIPLQPNALAWMRLGGELPPKNEARRWKRLREKAGFRTDGKPRKNPVSTTPKDGAPWPHDAMRHSFCSYAIPVFGFSKVADWHGDNEDTMIKHYRERVTESVAKEFWSITP